MRYVDPTGSPLLTPPNDSGHFHCPLDFFHGVADDAEFIANFEKTFADKINQITRDRELAEKMGKAGRQRCIDEFSWEKIAQETVQVYEAAIRAHEKNKAK